MDFAAALTRMRDLLRPGGTLVVLSLARNASVRDWAYEPVTVPWALLNRLLREKADPSPSSRLRSSRGYPNGMPMADPEMSYGEVREAARRILPGVRYRRRPLWRYSLVWCKPGGVASVV
ncbi:hypothetical protein AB0M28_18725 [Streptomyces sp. NPDC051940]|uniref:hypothetical protein n=1 Tax=Streptomyces sp. NPDC051940 TaxID=3155675 RepID=UPI003425899A